MKQMVVAYALLAASLSAFGQTETAAPGTTAASVEQTLVQLERDWSLAGLKNDASAFDRIVADDWMAIDFEGRVVNKAQAIANMKSGAAATQSVELGAMKVRVFGDTAVVTGSDTEKSAYKGTDISGKYAWMDVFVNRNGRWQAVASETTKVAN